MESKMDGTKYYYSVHVAKEISLEAAVVFTHLCIYVDYARREHADRKYHNGVYWTYASRKSIHDKLPYISQSSIYRALCALIEHGYIIKGNYNKTGYDRTCWYTITPKGWAVFKSNQEPFVHNGQSIEHTEQSFEHNGQSIDSTNTSIVSREQPIPIDTSMQSTMSNPPKILHKPLIGDFLKRRYTTQHEN